MVTTEQCQHFGVVKPEPRSDSHSESVERIKDQRGGKVDFQPQRSLEEKKQCEF